MVFQDLQLLIKENTHLATSPLGTLLDSDLCVSIVLVKLFLDVRDRILHIGSVAKPLFKLI